MNASVPNLRFDQFSMWLELDGGRTSGVPLASSPRLPRREDADISIRGLRASLGEVPPPGTV